MEADEQKSGIQPRIALFGGTFDPIHCGHLEMAQAAKEALGLDRVILIPCALSPHKTTGPMPAPGRHRLEMMRIACRAFPWIECDSFEIEQKGVSYSWETAWHFRARFAGALLFWILGDDQWHALPRWTHPERLAALVEFIVFSRNHGAPTPREGFSACFLPAVHEASATQIRVALQGEMRLENGHPWIQPQVMEYIRAHGLYGVEG